MIKKNSEFKSTPYFNYITIINSILLVLLFIFCNSDKLFLERGTLVVLILTLFVLIWYTTETRMMAITTKETLEFNKNLSQEEKQEEIKKIFEERKKILLNLIVELNENKRKSIYIKDRPNYRFTGFQDIYRHKFLYSKYGLDILANDPSVVDEICELYSSFEHANLIAKLLDKCEAMSIYTGGDVYKQRHQNAIQALKKLIQERILNDKNGINIDSIIKKLETIYKDLIKSSNDSMQRTVSIV